MKHGKGREKLPNGQYDLLFPLCEICVTFAAMCYDGVYANGLFHGQGDFVEEDGSLYSGIWSGGVRAGQGSQVNNRERHEYTGSFLDDLYANSSFDSIL